jgi:hemolysin III
MNVAALLAPLEHYRSAAERLADKIVHFIGIGFAAIGSAVLFGLALWQGGIGQAGIISIYALCLIAMIVASAIYNLLLDPRRRNLMRRLDHAAIFFMIAGSYTPFTILRFDGAWQFWMTAAVWTLALLGAAGKLFLPGISKKLWVVLYLVLGWLVVIAIRPMIETVPLAGLILLAVGGALYTLGVAFYVRERLPFRRAIWHGFVLAAAGVHYAAVLTGVVFA